MQKLKLSILFLKKSRTCYCYIKLHFDLKYGQMTFANPMMKFLRFDTAQVQFTADTTTYNFMLPSSTGYFNTDSSLFIINLDIFYYPINNS